MSLARQSFGLAPEPADGYPSGGAMLYGEEKGFEIVPVAQITSELMLALMAMQERSISAHLEAGPFSAQSERLTTPTDVEKWLAQPAVCDVRSSRGRPNAGGARRRRRARPRSGRGSGSSCARGAWRSARARAC